jgi:hypothetical protein
MDVSEVLTAFIIRVNALMEAVIFPETSITLYATILRSISVGSRLHTRCECEDGLSSGMLRLAAIIPGRMEAVTASETSLEMYQTARPRRASFVCVNVIH